MTERYEPGDEDGRTGAELMAELEAGYREIRTKLDGVTQSLQDHGDHLRDLGERLDEVEKVLSRWSEGGPSHVVKYQ